MRDEVLKVIIQLKQYESDPKIKDIKRQLERAVNKDIIDTLTSISLVADNLGYNGINELINEVSEVVEKLETGSILKNKANMDGEN